MFNRETINKLFYYLFASLAIGTTIVANTFAQYAFPLCWKSFTNLLPSQVVDNNVGFLQLVTFFLAWLVLSIVAYIPVWVIKSLFDPAVEGWKIEKRWRARHAELISKPDNWWLFGSLFNHR